MLRGKPSGAASRLVVQRSTVCLLSFFTLCGFASAQTSKQAPCVVDGTNAAQGEQGQEQAPTKSSATQSETSIRNIDTEIKVQVRLVLLRAVVKDASGKIVPNLKQEDFQVFDNGKPQRVSAFTVETAEPPQTITAPSAEGAAARSAPENVGKAEAAAGVVSPTILPKRFVTLVFDDLHLKVADAMAVHAATQKLFASFNPADRVAIYSTQGDVQQDFTGDPATLHKALAEIVPHSSIEERHHECPNISYYQADLIENHHDEEAIGAAQADATLNLCPTNVEGTARRILHEGDSQTEKTYQYLSDIVRKLTGMPGQRVLVYVSPGFLVGQTAFGDSWDWIEKAVRAGVVVNTIDARGLYTPEGMGDIDAPPQVGVNNDDPAQFMEYQRIEGQYRMQTQFEAGQVLASMAANTGGVYFHNRNDLNVGMARALEPPSVSYVLGFTPQSVTADGKFHTLKVDLTNGKKYQIQARNGYFAPRKLDPEEAAKEEIRETLFSQEEIINVPVQMKTGFYKSETGSAQLTVFTHLDISGLRFRKTDERSCDDVVIATAVFDNNGQFVNGQMKELTLKLRDPTLKKLGQTGITVKTEFTVKSGTYMVRSVVRGSEGAQLTSRNVTTVIP